MNDAERAADAAKEEQSERLGRAMKESNVVRVLVTRATDLELSRPPRLTIGGGSMWDPGIDDAWASVDEALRVGGF